MPPKVSTSATIQASHAAEKSQALAIKNEPLPGQAGGKLPFAIQPKLSVGAVDDPLEHEADTMADKVMRMPGESFIQRKCAECEKEEPVQLKLLPGFSAPCIQTKKEDNSFVGEAEASSIQSSLGKGSLLDEDTRSFMSSRFGTDFSSVKIHTDAASIQLSRNLNAQAFTVGNDVYFNEGKYQPSSAEGRHLIAHELVHTVQQNNNAIQRVAMPAEATVTNLDAYAAATRQNIRYDIGFDLQSNLALYFQPDIVTTVRPGYNVTYAVRGFAPTDTWVENPLKALALYHFNLDAAATGTAITNFTTVQHLDLASESNPADATMHGPNALVRFTSTQFDATGTGANHVQNVQLLIEKTGDFTARTSTETAAARRQRYASTYQITNAVPVVNDPLGDPIEAMSDTDFDLVLEALDIVPAAILSRSTGIPIHRGLTARGPHGEVAEYSQARAAGSTTWQRRITVYADFLSSTIEQRVFTMAHEMGHALDHRPNEGAGGRGGPSLSAARGAGSFRNAVTQDGGLGKGMSEYAATGTSHDEYYAEAFSMYINQPDTLRSLRPHVYDYFRAQYP